MKKETNKKEIWIKRFNEVNRQFGVLLQKYEKQKKEELEWLKSFQKHALKYYKFQNIEYNTKIEERIKKLEERL